jgi:hypothetical protein
VEAGIRRPATAENTLFTVPQWGPAVGAGIRAREKLGP